MDFVMCPNWADADCDYELAVEWADLLNPERICPMCGCRFLVRFDESYDDETGDCYEYWYAERVRELG